MLREDKTLGMLGDTLFSFPEGVGFRKEIPLCSRNSTSSSPNSSKAASTRIWSIGGWKGISLTCQSSPTPGRTASSWWASATAAAFLVAIKDNKLIGFEIELSSDSRPHLGKKIRFSQIDFSGLIAAVSTGKVDMIIAAIFITDERKQSINFSDPYYEEGTKALRFKEEHYGL